MAPDVDELIPEWREFREAVSARRPDQGTACSAWTVRDIVAHNAGNAEELGRVLLAHLMGEPVPPTRSFEDREPRFRNLPDADLIRALDGELDELVKVLDEATRVDPDELVPWTGRQMKVAWFAEHMREELILHRWDVVGDDEISTQYLGQPWLTEHSVLAVGAPLLRKGASSLDEHDQLRARVRAQSRPDVIVEASSGVAAITLGQQEDDAVIHTDPAARVLLLWGRQPTDPGRMTSAAGPSVLGQLRSVLAGY